MASTRVIISEFILLNMLPNKNRSLKIQMGATYLTRHSDIKTYILRRCAIR